MAKRIQDLKTPTTRFGERVVGLIVRPFERLSQDQKFWFGFGAVCLLTTLLINNPLLRQTLWHNHNGHLRRRHLLNRAVQVAHSIHRLQPQVRK